MDNICRFVSINSSPDPIQTINFVYETDLSTLEDTKTEAVYKVCFVTEGKAKICLGTVEKEISRDDIFFIVPAIPYKITPEGKFGYMYITFMGLRAGMIMERLGITRSNFVFEDF